MLFCFIVFKTGGRFKWVDRWRMYFTKWGKNEPKRNYGCVYMDIDRKWKTAPCTDNHYSLCKRSPGLSAPLYNKPRVLHEFHVLSPFQTQPPLILLSSPESVQNQPSINPGYLSEDIVTLFSIRFQSAGPRPQLTV